MRDITILKAMTDKALFLKYSPILYKLDNLQKELRLILNAIKSYYTKYKEKEGITTDELEGYFYHLNPQVQDPELYDFIFKQLEAAQIENPALLTDILNQIVERHYMTKIAMVSNDMVQEITPSAYDEVMRLAKQLKDVTESIQEAENDVCDSSLEDLLLLDSQAGLRWRLGFMHSVFGPLKSGYLGHFFARPDAGKTSFALSELTHFAFQLSPDRPGLYLNNEEGISRIKLRAYSALIGVSINWIHSNMIKAEEHWNNYGGDRLKFIGEVNDLSQVEQYVDTFNPRVVFIDQGPKLFTETGKNENDVKRLQKIYNRLRTLTVDYDTSIITLGQADKDAEGKMYLTLNNMADSKVAIQGELDFGVGIGKRNDAGYEFIRYMSCVKNKLTGGYGKGQCTFKIESSRFED